HGGGVPPPPLGERGPANHPLAGGGQPEPAHVAASPAGTGRPSRTDRAAARAIARAARASPPPTGGGVAPRTASAKAASPATYAPASSSWSLRTISTVRPVAPE